MDKKPDRLFRVCAFIDREDRKRLKVAALAADVPMQTWILAAIREKLARENR